MGDYIISLEEVATKIAALNSIIEDMDLSSLEAYDLFGESNGEDAENLKVLFNEVITVKQTLRDAFESTRDYLLTVQKTMTEMDKMEREEIAQLGKVVND